MDFTGCRILIRVALILRCISTATTTFISHGQGCNSTSDSCENGTFCLQGTTNETVCICNISHYRDDNERCTSIDQVSVSNINVIQKNTDSITLSWSTNIVNKTSALYWISINSMPFMAAEKFGARLRDLKTDAPNVFTIQVTIPQELHYAARTGPNITYAINNTLDCLKLIDDKISKSKDVSDIMNTTSALKNASHSISKDSNTTTYKFETKGKETEYQQKMIVIIAVCVTFSVIIIITVIICFVRYRKRQLTRKTEPQYDSEYKHASVSISPESFYSEVKHNGISDENDSQKRYEGTKINLNSDSCELINEHATYFNEVDESTAQVSNIVSSSEHNGDNVNVCSKAICDAEYSHLFYSKTQKNIENENIYHG